MVKSKSALLALIHQYLLKNGYCQAARELQRENGENFATSKITLQRVYKLWTKKSKKKKKKKKEEAKQKKRDHDSKKAEHLDLALQAKESSGTKAKKAKQVKKMNLATEAAADVKVISKKASASLNDNPGSSVTQEADVFPDGNYSSVVHKAASLKSKPGAEKSNESSFSSETEETTKQVARGKKIPDPAAAEQKSHSKPSNGKAEVSESSADSDETDIDKLPASVTSKPTVTSSQKASKGKRQAVPPVQKVQADSSTESSETDEEDEPVKQLATPTSKLASPPAVSAAKLKAQSLLPASQSVKAQSSESDSEEEPVKQDKTPAKAVKAAPTKPKKGLGKAATPARANASVVKNLHSRMLVSETESDSSDSEEQQKTPSAITSKIATASPLTPLAAAKVGMQIKTELPSEETSEEESSESDEEPTTKTPATVTSTPQLKTFSVGIKQTPVVAAKTPLKSSQPVDESSEEESTDSDEESSVKKPSTVLQASHLKTPVVEAKQTSAVAKSKSPSKAPQPASESSEESDSNGEPVAKKPAAVHLSQPKTPSGGAKQASVLAKTHSPAKTTPLADESSEESESEEETAAKKPATAVQSSQLKTPSGGAKQTTLKATLKTPLKTAQQDSESSEESDTDEETDAKKPTTAVQSSQLKTPSGRAKQTTLKATLKTPLKTAQQDSESSEESDTDEETDAKKPATAVQSSQLKTPSGGAKRTTLKATLKTPLKTAQQDSESSEESDTDEETDAKKPATALQSTQPKSPSGDPKQTAMRAKSETTQPNVETSEESDSDEEADAKATPAVQVKMSVPASSVLTVKQTFTVQVPDSDADSESSESSDTEHKQRSKSTAPVKVQEKTPAVAGKKVTKPAAADATDSSDSDDEEKAWPKPSAVSRGVKAKQSASPALKPDKSSEESESESDEAPVKPAEVKTLATQKEKLSASQQKTTAQPAAIVSKGKSLVSRKMAAFSQAMADSSESTESSDNEDLPPAQVPTPPAAKFTVQPAAVAKRKAGVPTKSVPGRKLAEVDQGTPDGSESSDGEEEQPDAQKLELSVEAKQKKKPMSAPLLTSTPYESTVSKGKGAVPASTHPVAKETDISESSDTESDEEDTKQVATPTPSFVKSKSGRITDTLAKTSTSSNPAIAKTTTPFKVPPKLKKDPAESSSESSDSEPSEEAAVKVNTPVPTAVKASQPKVSGKLKTPNVTNPVPGKPNASSQQKPKQVDTDSSSESSDSEAKPAVKTAVQKGTTPGPTAKKMKQESQSNKVVKTPLAPKPLPSKPIGTSVAKTPLQAGEESSSESSDSEEDTAEKPPPATPKPVAQPSVGKTTTRSPAVLQKKQEVSSEESDSDEEEPVKKPTAATPKPAAQPTTRSPAVLQKKQEDSSEESETDEKEPVKKAKGAATGNPTSSKKSVERSVGKMSSTDVKKIRPAVPSTPSGGSKPKDSQALLKAFFPVITTPNKRKKESKTTNVLDSVAGKSKKKEVKKVQPDTVPVLPMALPEQSPSAVALLESEEETVLALLEGRSPKKAKKNKMSKKAAETAVFDFATPLVQNNDVALKSPLPQPFLSSTWVPESPTSGDDKSVQPTTELPSLSSKKVKSSKKRKIPQDLDKQNQKPAKKAKQEKKIQGMVEEANVTAKPKSDKNKSENDRSNKKTKTKEKKENKEGKKKAESMAAAVVESADSGIGLSKPKKKRKT